MDKDTLRREAKRRRSKLTKSRVKRLSSKILQQTQEYLNWDRIETLHVYSPIEEKCEPDCSGLLEYVWENYPHIKTYTNRKTGDVQEIVEIDRNTHYERNELGIPVPVEGVNVGKVLLSVVVMPLLAFDDRGNRVGYGSGYYDKLLTKHPEAYKVGFTYDTDKVDRIYPTKRDIPMDVVITEETIYECNS